MEEWDDAEALLDQFLGKHNSGPPVEVLPLPSRKEELGKLLHVAKKESEEKVEKVGKKTKKDKKEKVVAEKSSPSFLDSIAKNIQEGNYRKSVLLKEAPLLQSLAENGFSDKDVWEGDPKLFPVLYTYKYILESMGGSVCIVTFNLPPEDFHGASKKSYNIHCNKTAGQVVELICKRLNVPNTHDYVLSTLRGFVFHDSHTLLSYGLGILYKNWELKVQRRDVTNVSKMNLSSCIITLQLPPMSQFKGMASKTLKVDVNTTVGKLLESLCKKFGVNDMQQLVLVTDYASMFKDKKPREGPRDVILKENATLASYGLGNRFETWQLRVTFKELTNSYLVDNMNTDSIYRFCLIHESNLTSREAQEIIMQQDRDLQVKISRIASLEIHREEMDKAHLDQIIKLHNEIIYLNNGITVLQRDVSTLNSSKNLCEQQLAQARDTNRKLLTGVQQLALEKSHLQEAVAKLNLQLQDANEKHGIEVRMLKQVVRQQEDQRRQIEADLQIQKMQSDEQERQKNDEVIRRKQLEKQLKETSEKLILAQGTIETLELTKQFLSERIESGLKEGEAVKTERQMLTRELEKLQGEVGKMSAQVQSNELELEHYRERTSRLEEQLKQQQTDNGHLKNELLRLQHELQDANSQATYWKQELSETTQKSERTLETMKREQELQQAKYEELKLDFERLLQEKTECENKLKERETLPRKDFDFPAAPTPPPINLVASTLIHAQTSLASEIQQRRTTLTPVDQTARNPRRVNDLADLIYTSLQQRFSNMNRDIVEDLEESSIEESTHSVDFLDDWK